jgi:diacylglycerol kinase
MPLDPPPCAELKGRPFHQRLGFAAAGIRTVARRESSFRTQLALAASAGAALLLLRPGWLWTALVLLATGLVLALELLNAALEYLIDHLHPGIAEEIRHAKDAAAGAVLIASLTAAAVAMVMVTAQL